MTLKLLIPVGGSRGNIIQACKIKNVADVKFLLTRSLFPGKSQLKNLISAVTNYGFENIVNIQASYIEGPDAGPKKCHNSILEFVRTEEDYIPELIFVTGSTTLIVATLARLYPSAKLVSLRGNDLVVLDEVELITGVEPINVENYLKIHGLNIDEEKNLYLNGIQLKSPKLHDCKIEGSRVSFTWAKEEGLRRKDTKLEAQAIGTVVKKIIQEIGPGSFTFNSFGYNKFMENSSDMIYVNTKPKIEQYNKSGFSKGKILLNRTPAHVNVYRAMFDFDGGLTGILSGENYKFDSKYNLIITGELNNNGSIILKLAEDEEE